MRLDPAEIPELPLPAALLDRRRDVVAATPEWRGSAPGSVTYYAGHGYLAVGAGQPVDRDLHMVLGELLHRLDLSIAGMGAEEALRARVLAGGLRLVAGEPISDTDLGWSSEVLSMARLSIASRVNPPLAVQALDHDPPLQVPGPAIVALALVQFAVNIARHERADAAGDRPVEAITIRAAEGPTFQVEWASEAPRSTVVETRRHVRRRRRWGLGYVRMAADALGGAALPPAPAGPDRESVSFGLGSRNLTLPLALLEDGRPARSTRAWDQEHHVSGEEAGTEQRALLMALAAEAQRNPGEITWRDFHTARAMPHTGRVWLAMPPEVGEDRVRDVLRGLDHERLLLSAPEPHATHVHALNVILRHGLGEPLTTCYRSEWQARFPSACQGLGIGPQSLSDVPVYPDPLLAAWLVAQVGGELEADPGGTVWFRPAAGIDDPRLRLLDPSRRGAVRLTEGMGF